MAEKLPSMSQCASSEDFLNRVLKEIWEIPLEVRVQNKISTNFLLKWHSDYLRDKSHVEIKDGSFQHYIYRDETKFYILPYKGTKIERCNKVWVSIRKSEKQTHGYALIKKVQE